MFEMRLDPPTHPADDFDPAAVAAAEYSTEVINLCELLGETDARFQVSDFGEAVAIAAPSLEGLSPFNAWRHGEFEW
jgi:hypothetical protein